jgi:hypothetical protein
VFGWVWGGVEGCLVGVWGGVNVALSLCMYF